MKDISNEPVQPTEPPPAAGGRAKSKWLKRKIYETESEKKKDFWIGFVLFFVLIIVMLLCAWGLGFGQYQDTPLGQFVISTGILEYRGDVSYYAPDLTIILVILALVSNISLIVYFAFTRNRIAQGMSASFGVLLSFTLLAVVATLTFIFSSELPDNSGEALIGFVVLLIFGAPFFLVALIMIGVVAGMFYAHSKSTKDIMSLRMAKFLAVMIAIIISFAVLSTIGFIAIDIFLQSV